MNSHIQYSLLKGQIEAVHWWHASIILGLGNPRQEDGELEATLGYRVETLSQ